MHNTSKNLNGTIVPALAAQNAALLHPKHRRRRIRLAPPTSLDYAQRKINLRIFPALCTLHA
jgi:hypothetical protein